jgi:hypothetical protein
MSGGNIPYQLRPNKHVERLLFVELLEKIVVNEPDKYAYISMGGPQLEDHRHIHQSLAISSLYSFEEDKAVYQRQLFNLRPSCVECIPSPIDDFINGFDNFVEQRNLSDKNLIIWLDYASPSKRREQLIQYHTLLSKLQEQDVVKITLNANPATLGEKYRNESAKDLLSRRLERLQNEIGEYLPPEIVADDMTGSRLVPVLCKSIEIAAEKGASNYARLTPLLLSLFSYQDGNHLMVTATVRLTKIADVQSYRSSLKWKYLPKSWDDVQKINIPALTAKERLEIDRWLPANDYRDLHNRLPFQLDTDFDLSLELLQEYATHYTRYPSYFQVIL